MLTRRWVTLAGAATRRRAAATAPAGAVQQPRRMMMMAADKMPTTPESKRLGPVSWVSALLIVGAGYTAMTLYQAERDKVKAKIPKVEIRELGKAKLGGPFNLIDQDGHERSDKDFRGKFMFMYFGFTFCPDVCPEELSKMVQVVDMLDASPDVPKDIVQPIFISVDPKRDTPEVMRDYLKDFSPKLIGLTGSLDTLKSVTKAFRVYFSSGEGSDPNSTEYLVDHSIFFFLMDPEGEFLSFYGQNKTASEITQAIKKHVATWRPSNK